MEAAIPWFKFPRVSLEQNEREKVEKQWNQVQNEVQTENDTMYNR